MSHLLGPLQATLTPPGLSWEPGISPDRFSVPFRPGGDLPEAPLVSGDKAGALGRAASAHLRGSTPIIKPPENPTGVMFQGNLRSPVTDLEIVTKYAIREALGLINTRYSLFIYVRPSPKGL